MDICIFFRNQKSILYAVYICRFSVFICLFIRDMLRILNARKRQAQTHLTDLYQNFVRAYLPSSCWENAIWYGKIRGGPLAKFTLPVGSEVSKLVGQLRSVTSTIRCNLVDVLDTRKVRQARCKPLRAFRGLFRSERDRARPSKLSERSTTGVIVIAEIVADPSPAGRSVHHKATVHISFALDFLYRSVNCPAGERCSPTVDTPTAR